MHKMSLYLQNKKMRFCTLHEYRFSYGLIALLGMFTGLSDASIDDFTVKAFLWTFFFGIVMAVIAYELILMPTPSYPKLQSIFFILFGYMGLLSIHHFTWLATWILLGKPLERKLWLMPNVFGDLYIYTLVMGIMLIAYISYLIFINMRDCEDL